MPKLGPDNNFTAYIYIYIYMHACHPTALAPTFGRFFGWFLRMSTGQSIRGSLCLYLLFCFHKKGKVAIEKLFCCAHANFFDIFNISLLSISWKRNTETKKTKIQTCAFFRCSYSWHVLLKIVENAKMDEKVGSTYTQVLSLFHLYKPRP